MKEQAVMNPLTPDNASTEASRQLIFKPVREMLKLTEMVMNLGAIWKIFAKFWRDDNNLQSIPRSQVEQQDGAIYCHRYLHINSRQDTDE